MAALSNLTKYTLGIISIIFLVVISLYSLITSLLVDAPLLFNSLTLLLHATAVGSIFFLFYELIKNSKAVMIVIILISLPTLIFFARTFWLVNIGMPDSNIWVFIVIQLYPALYVIFSILWKSARVLFYKIVCGLYLFLAIVVYSLILDQNISSNDPNAVPLMVGTFILAILPGVWVLIRSLKS